ncbi:uncharacterized protein LOC125199099 [Salvia hispanica]|uniref:uncharacterized protein LOC125199099 n=1 Tax=Salvia hispanica TaxID=49212 RepID=UPI0020099E21|nr:uncharacterized protein LOC125199099 [Salvia hispanica]
MKLPLDLTTLDLSVNDKFARISSLVLMSTAMSNFMTSLGSMEDNEIVLNMAALGILVVTIAGNVCIHIAKIHSFGRRLNLFLPQQSFRDEVNVDKYWTWRLVEWRDRSLPFQVQSRVCKKLLRDAVRFVLNFCIGAQILVVLAAKLVLFLSARFGIAVLLCLRKNERPVLAGAYVNFRQYVLLLEGEPQLPNKILENICNEADELIKGGEKRQPENLIQLLKKSSNFNGLGRFDSSEIPSLHSQEPPNCWSMPVVTLTAISVALLNIADEKANQLMVCISEGLPIVKLIEETLDRTGELESIRKAADVVWIGAEVYRKWEDTDIKSTSVRGTTHKETLQNLSKLAEKIVTDFVAQTRDILMQNPLNWPARVIAANSMYRIAQTILLGMGDGENQTDDELFDSISITISDILAACLTNLVQVITLKCHRNDIKEREESVSNVSFLVWMWRKLLRLTSGGHPWHWILKILFTLW